MQHSNLNPKNTGKSQSESVGKEKSVESYPSAPSFESLKGGEDRASYLTRQGLAGILEYEKKENGVHWSRQEKDMVAPQFKRLHQEIGYHENLIMNYLMGSDPRGSNTDVETGISVKQVEESFEWLERIAPDVGQQFRQEIFLKQKDWFNKEKLETENTDSKDFTEEKGENQVSQQQYKLVTEQSSLTRASNGLGASQYLLGGLLAFYVVKKIYESVYKSKNKKKD